jgi:hypothetical protein
MAFTYAETLLTDRDKIRLRIGDTQTAAGPRPDKRNFSDAEIAFVLTEETAVNASIAHLFEILASEWTSYSISEKDADVSFDAKGLAETYHRRALEWRAKPGGTAVVQQAGGWVTLDRTDAWTNTGEYVQ